MKKVAYCWASGLIEIGDATPDGAIPIATGEDIPLRWAVGVLAVQGYDGSWRVPGFGFATSPDQKVNAVLEFGALLRREEGVA